MTRATFRFMFLNRGTALLAFATASQHGRAVHSLRTTHLRPTFWCSTRISRLSPGGTGTDTPSAFRPTIIHSPEASWLVRMVQTSVVRDPPTTLRTRVTWAVRSPMAARTITDGRIVLVFCRRAKRSTIRSVGPAMITAFRTRQIPPADARPASLVNILKFDVPIADVLAFPPQAITSPLAIEGTDSSFTGIDFVPDAFVTGPVQPGAALYGLEGRFWVFSGECDRAGTGNRA